MLQALLKDRGGTVETYFVDRRPTSCTVSIYDGSGSAKVDSAACTVDSVNTTTTASVDVDVDTISLASVTGIVAGRRYLLGGTVPEVVSVKAVAGSAVTLWAPLGLEHASGSAFQGLRVSYAVSGASCGALWWDGYADFVPDSGDVQTESVDCVRRKVPEQLIDVSDIRELFSEEQKALSASLDLPRAFRSARDQMLIDFGGKNRANTLIGTDHFRRPCAAKFWLMRRHEFGPEWQDAMTVLEREYDGLIQRLISQVPVDADQDGSTNGPNDRGFTVITLERA